MADDFRPGGFTTLTATPTSPTTATAMTVGDTSEWPTAPFNLVIHRAGQKPRGSNAEIVRILAYSGTAVSSMTRGVNAYWVGPLSLQAGDWCYPSMYDALSQMVNVIDIDQTVTGIAATHSIPNTIDIYYNGVISNGGIDGLTMTLYSVPAANAPAGAAVNGIVAYVRHDAGNFTNVLLRPLAGTVTQNFAGLVGEARGLQGTLYAQNSGGITEAIAVSADLNVNDSGASGYMTRAMMLRGRVLTVDQPVDLVAIQSPGYVQLSGNMYLGALTEASNIALAIVNAITSTAAHAYGVAIASPFTADANSRIFTGLNIRPTVADAAKTGLVYRGLALFDPPVTGGGTFASKTQLYFELPTGGTVNHYFEFATALSAAPGGAVQGSIKVFSPSGVGYIEVKAA